MLIVIAYDGGHPVRRVLTHGVDDQVEAQGARRHQQEQPDEAQELITRAHYAAHRVHVQPDEVGARVLQSSAHFVSLVNVATLYQYF